MIETSFLDSGNILLNLHQGDFSTTNRVTEAINDVFGTDVATALDSTTIKVRAPIDPSQKVSFVSLLENIEVEPARPRAKVVVNARTGTIVIGGDVRVSAAAVTHGSLTVRVKEDTDITQTQNIAVADGVAATVPGDVVETPDTNIEVNEEFARAFVFDPGVELSSIVDALNAVGGTPSDLVAILEALREAGSLRAELIVI
jgi:flagellar P-ring protein precursor FlgI